MIYSMDDAHFMSMAVISSQDSHCVSTKVGAVVVMDGKIVSNGANNVAVPTMGRRCSDFCKHILNDEGKLKSQERPRHSAWSDHNEIHAEMRAIMTAHINGVVLRNATLYTTSSPCPQCAKHLEFYAVHGAISRIVYLDKYDRGNDEWIKSIGKYITIDKMERRELPYIDFGKIVTNNNE